MSVIVDAIFNALTDIITSYATTIGGVFTNLVSIFYNDEGLTLMGTLLLLGIGVGIVKWAFNLVTGLIRL